METVFVAWGFAPDGAQPHSRWGENDLVKAKRIRPWPKIMNVLQKSWRLYRDSLG